MSAGKLHQSEVRYMRGGSEVLIVDNGRCDENMVCWKWAAGSSKAVGQSGSAELYARSAGDPEREREVMR